MHCKPASNSDCPHKLDFEVVGRERTGNFKVQVERSKNQSSQKKMIASSGGFSRPLK
mgnify:CR=1 FL=1